MPLIKITKSGEVADYSMETVSELIAQGLATHATDADRKSAEKKSAPAAKEDVK